MNEFVKKQQQLKHAYINSMPAKRDSLQQQLANWLDNPSDTVAFYSELHKLSGSAGMYGFFELSNAAKVLMESLEAATPDNTKFRQAFADLIGMMKSIG